MKEYWKKHKKIISGVIIAIICVVIVVTYHHKKNRIEDEIMYRKFEIAMEWFGHRNFQTYGDYAELAKELGIDRNTADFSRFYSDYALPYIWEMEEEGIAKVWRWDDDFTEVLIDIIEEDRFIEEETKQDAILLLTGGFEIIEGTNFSSFLSSVIAIQKAYKDHPSYEGYKGIDLETEFYLIVRGEYDYKNAHKE